MSKQDSDAMIDASHALAAAREMLCVLEDHGGHDGLGGKGLTATLDQIDDAKKKIHAALEAGLLPGKEQSK